MAKCAYCNSTILFGGARDGDLRFCNSLCLKNGVAVRLAKRIPDEMIQGEVEAIHHGPCPQCSGPGPVDVHVSYRVWSALVMTSWQSRPQLCCPSCGVRNKLGDALFSLVLGWWGVPWGFLITPIQIVRNLAGLAFAPDPCKPSKALAMIVRTHMAQRFLEERQGENAPS